MEMVLGMWQKIYSSWSWGQPFFMLGSIVFIYCLLVQRNMVQGWDMMSSRPTFCSARKEWHGLEIPKGTVIEVECVPELVGEV